MLLINWTWRCAEAGVLAKAETSAIAARAKSVLRIVVRVMATSSQRALRTLSSFFTIILLNCLLVLGSGEPFAVSPFGKDGPPSNKIASSPL
jgi:hypothetical protein